MQNIEIKTRLDDRAAIERRLEALGAKRIWSRRQRDTFFRVGVGWLKLRESPGQRPQLIAYRRTAHFAQPSVSDYDTLDVSSADRCKRLLSRVLPADAVVEKQRDLWIHRHTRIHLDRLKGPVVGVRALPVKRAVDRLDSGQALGSSMGR
jgi:adenylate cyclase class IV